MSGSLQAASGEYEEVWNKPEAISCGDSSNTILQFESYIVSDTSPLASGHTVLNHQQMIPGLKKNNSSAQHGQLRFIEHSHLSSESSPVRNVHAYGVQVERESKEALSDVVSKQSLAFKNSSGSNYIDLRSTEVVSTQVQETSRNLKKNSNSVNKKKPSIDLTKSKSCNQKPPILSPKPFIAPKPKNLNDTHPICLKDQSKDKSTFSGLNKDQSGPSSTFNYKNSVIRRVSPPSPVKSVGGTSVANRATPSPVNKTNVATNAWKYTTSAPYIPGKNFLAQPSNTKVISPTDESRRNATHSSKRVNGINHRQIIEGNNLSQGRMNHSLEAESQIFKFPQKKPESNVEKCSLKVPPKIATKPKFRSNTSNAKQLGTEETKRKDSNGEIIVANNVNTEDPSLVPVSEIRSKFEQMKIKFKKPIPDPVFKNAAVNRSENKGNTNLSTAATELFKDILEMNSLPDINDDDLKKNNSVDNNSLLPQNRRVDEAFQKTTDRQINSLRLAPSVTNKPEFCPSDIPAPRTEMSGNLSDVDFTDLPPPPDFSDQFQNPALNEQPKNHSTVTAVDKNVGLAKTSNSASSLVNKDAGFHQLDNRTFAPGLNSGIDNVIPGFTSQTLEKCSADTTRHNQTDASDNGFARSATTNSDAAVGSLDESSVNTYVHSSATESRDKYESRFSVENGCETARNTANTNVSVDNLENRNFPMASPSSAIKKSRNIDEEILYYDNMDIMEKVRQKREQDEARRKKYNNSETIVNKVAATESQIKPNHPKKQNTINDKNMGVSISPKILPSSPKKHADNDKASPINSVISDNSIKTKVSYSKESLDFKQNQINANLEQATKAQVLPDPPKLPPKQLKFNRKMALQTAEKQVSPGTETQTNSPNEPIEMHNDPSLKSKNLRLNISNSNVQLKPHIPSPMPVQKAPQFNPPTQPNAHSSTLVQNQVLCQQLTPEDARARQLVDEPLAPIIEEDSTYGDSSSCASSVTGDDKSFYNDEYSVKSFYSTERTGSPLDSTWSSSVNSLRRGLDEDSDQDLADGESTEVETDAALPVKENSSAIVHSSSYTDESDSSSVCWQSNPMLSKRQYSQDSESTTDDVFRPSTEKNREIESVRPQPSQKQGILKKYDSTSSDVSRQEAKRRNMANSLKHQTSQETSDIIEDVEPYGMVDLTKLQHTIEEDNRSVDKTTQLIYKVSQPPVPSAEVELTPSSIMHSVSEFNASVGMLPKSPVKERKFSFDLDSDAGEVPTFPSPAKAGKSPDMRSNTLPSQQTRGYKTSSHFSNNHEEVGYDNLENYGGAARQAADKKKLREASLSTEYTQGKVDNREKHHNPKYNIGLAQNQSFHSQDSLSSELGLADQRPGSRSSFPLPASESRLARHSSAVRTVDKHSRNLKRAKESGRLEALNKSPSARKIEKQFQPTKQQSSTLPRSLSTESQHTFEPRPLENHSRSTESFHLRQASIGSESSKSNNETDTQNVAARPQDNKSYPLSNNNTYVGEAHAQALQKNFQHKSDNNLSRVDMSNYDESQDDGIVNPYEEVPFVTETASNSHRITPAAESEEQKEAKTRVREMLENIKPPESPYRPKPPLPRYPVEYDNFYLGQKGDPKIKSERQTSTDNEKSYNIINASPATSPTSSSLSQSEEAGLPSTSVNTAASPTLSSSSDHSNLPQASSNLELSSQTTLRRQSDEGIKSKLKEPIPGRKSSDPNIDAGSYSSSESSSYTSRSLGSQLRSLLGGNQDSKYISPSLRRKRSLLKRSKSPGGSRRSKTPPRSKSPSCSIDDSSSSKSGAASLKEEKRNDGSSENKSNKSETESPERTPFRRSASQRLMDRRGRRGSRSKQKTSEEESSDHTLERRKKVPDKTRMSARWRRSKSQDRSPTRSKSKERSIFNKRSKSQERPQTLEYEAKDIELDDKEREGRGFFRRHRSSSRKRGEKRGKSSERNDDRNPSGGRGRNPVSFFRKLLRNKKSSDDDDGLQHSLEKDEEIPQSSEALNTTLTNANSDPALQENWTSPQHQTSEKDASNNNEKSTPKEAVISNKATTLPSSYRVNQTSSHQYVEHSTESSSEGCDKKHATAAKHSLPHQNLGASVTSMQTPHMQIRPSSRKSSFSNSVPSSDSEHQTKTTETKQSIREFKPNRPSAGRNKEQTKGLRKNLLMNRDYDSDTATSVLASDADSSAGIHSDTENSDAFTRKRQTLNATRGNTETDSFRQTSRLATSQRSNSEPSIAVKENNKKNDNNATLKLDNNKHQPSSTNGNEKKRSSKPNAHRRRSQKQTRRQTAPVDLAYATHQRQKYKTLVSLNAQTLRKVTERWLSEWRNQLPVGGFLITSWSDIALTSHRPLCMVGNSVVYSSVSTGNNKFKLACQLYDQLDINEQMIRKLDNCASLPAHPNTCGVCSHFPCRVPRSLLDPSSGGGPSDSLCVVLSNRPIQSLQEYLDRACSMESVTEYHKKLLINILQLLQGIKHLLESGYDVPQITAEHLVITEDRGFLQILPHLGWFDFYGASSRNLDKITDSYMSSDSESNSYPGRHRSFNPQQIGNLIKRFLQNAGDRSSTASQVSKVVVPATKYSNSIKHIIKFLERSPAVSVQEAAEVVQCALWGPEDIEEIGVDDVSPYAALELWIDMEQAKLVNSLAVLTPNERLVPLSFLKHQYFASVVPEVLFNGLKVLQRI